MEPFFPYKPEEHFSAPRKVLISDYNQSLRLYNEQLKAFEVARRALVQREIDLQALREAIETVNE